MLEQIGTGGQQKSIRDCAQGGDRDRGHFAFFLPNEANFCIPFDKFAIFTHRFAADCGLVWNGVAVFAFVAGQLFARVCNCDVLPTRMSAKQQTGMSNATRIWSGCSQGFWPHPAPDAPALDFSAVLLLIPTGSQRVAGWLSDGDTPGKRYYY